MSKNVLVTGVAGFIGRHVAAEALRRGYSVTGLDRRPCNIDGIEFVQADIRDADRVRPLLKGKESVIHLAAITSNVEFIKNPRECYDINANGFLGVVDAAAETGCTRFVYASSAAVYVKSFSEADVIDVGRQANHYAKTKLMNEMVAASYEDIGEMKTTGLRYFNVYGTGENQKGDYASIITILLDSERRGQPLVLYGDGTQARDLIHVTDVARITLDLLEKGSQRLYNVGTGRATSYVTIARMINADRVQYVPNPLSSYQYYTRADTARLTEALGHYEIIELENAIERMKA
jgi:UDP-glucose 4-epimerase